MAIDFLKEEPTSMEKGINMLKIFYISTNFL